jgi:hypothetical protein
MTFPDFDTVYAQAGHLSAPVPGLLTAIGEVDELAALPPGVRVKTECRIQRGFMAR